MRKSQVERTTRETRISISLTIEGSGQAAIDLPLGFLGHMLESMSRHGLFDLHVSARGDLEVDQHHLVEDLGIMLGRAFRQALGDKRGINRAGFFVYPMDDSLAVVAVDIGGRPFLQFGAKFRRRMCGDLDTDVLQDFFQGLASGLECNLVVRMPFGRSDHHKIEAIFKALGKALKMACSTDPRAMEGIPSTKGVIDGDCDS